MALDPRIPRYAITARCDIESLNPQVLTIAPLDRAAVKLEQTLAVLHPADDLEWGVGTRGV